MKTEFDELVKRAKKGDSEAFSKLYAQIYKELYYYALCNLDNSYDAADAVSDAVVDAYTGIKNLKDINAFKAWMYKILTAKIKRKQAQYIKERENTVALDESYAEHEKKENKYIGVEILQQLDLLNEQERMCFSLNVLEGYTSEEISKLTGIKPATVRSSLSRGRQKLRESLSEQ